MRIRVVSVPVSNQERAKRFYVDTLGFELLAESPMGPDQRWIQVGPKGGETSITLVTWFPSMSPGSLRGLVLEVDDLQEAIQELGGRGVDFSGGIEKAEWGTYVTFEDPDGNGWVLQQPAG